MTASRYSSHAARGWQGVTAVATTAAAISHDREVRGEILGEGRSSAPSSSPPLISTTTDPSPPSCRNRSAFRHSIGVRHGTLLVGDAAQFSATSAFSILPRPPVSTVDRCQRLSDALISPARAAISCSTLSADPLRSMPRTTSLVPALRTTTVRRSVSLSVCRQ